jgi:putative ABC transport system permease protein
MKFYDVADLALRNLRESVLRNSLTTVGISVGVASLVAMLSLGIGLQQLAARHLQKSGLFDTVFVTSRRDVRNFSREQEENGPAPADSPALTATAVKTMEALPNVAEVYPDIRFVTEIRYDGKPHLTSVAGLPQSGKSSDAMDGMQGRYFASETALEVIILKSFGEQLLGNVPKQGAAEPTLAAVAGPLIGKQIVMQYAERTSSPEEVAQQDTSGLPPEVAADAAAYSVVSKLLTLQIVGVTELNPDGMRGQQGARVYLPLKLAESLHVLQPADLRDAGAATGNEATYSTVSVRVKNPKFVPSVEEAIKKSGFNTFSITDATKSLRQFFAVLDLFLGIFGSLALAVASIGIVNTLVMAILERRREIGIMKAIGASDQDVRGLFFAEAGAMGVLGGILGVALGWTIGHVINFGTNVYLKRQQFPPEQVWSVPWWLVFSAIAFSIIVSLLSGLYPASRAARLDPVQALRYE